MITVSFPGVGIDSFNLNPVAFTLPFFGGLEVRWYGIIITLGIILAFTYAAFRAKQEGIIFDDVLDIAIFTVIFGIIGARLYYVLTSLGEYDSFFEMIAIWEGGLAIYGGIIAGAITILLVCRFKKIKFLKMFDATAPAVMIGQILGRWGNFFNGEAYGEELKEGAFLYFARMGLIPNIESPSRMYYFHPTFLYESLWNLVGFVIINALYKKKKFDGQIVLMYAAWYGFGRMLIEGLRTDSLYVGVFRISQVVGFVCFVVGTLLLVIGLVKARRAALTAREYEPSYPKFVTTASTAGAETAESEAVSETDAEENSDGEIPEEADGRTDDDAAEEHIDISDKLEKLFGAKKESEENENGKDN